MENGRGNDFGIDSSRVYVDFIFAAGDKDGQDEEDQGHIFGDVFGLWRRDIDVVSVWLDEEGLAVDFVECGEFWIDGSDIGDED